MPLLFKYEIVSFFSFTNDVNSEIKDNTNSLCCQLDFRK